MTDAPEPDPTRSPRRRMVLVASGIAVLFLAGLFAVLRPSDADDTASSTSPVPAETTTASATTEPETSSTEIDTATEPATEPPAETTAPAVTDDTGPMRIRITVAGGRPTGGIVREMVPQGADVLLVVRADAPEIVHLHGYDKEAPVAPNAPAQLGFKADQPGRFEVELEESGVLIAEISVEP